MSQPDPDVLLEFVRAGGQITLTEWVGLTAPVRAALAEAGRERDTERAHEFAATVCAHISAAVLEAQVERDLIAGAKRIIAKLEKGEAA